MIRDRIKNIRKGLKMSQHEFAAFVGVRQSNICRIESSATKRPRKKTLEKIASACNVTMEYLCNGTPQGGGDKRKQNFQKCWYCKHATNATNVCSWAARLKPVKGWKAAPVIKGDGTQTYHIIYCPLFESDGTESYGKWGGISQWKI